jgi:Ca2+-binding RTX toxin-like protein
MRPGTIVVIAVCLAVAGGWTARANAQCANATCNQAADHWSFTNLIAGGWDVKVGMMQSGGVFRPAICGWSAAVNKWILSGGDANGHQYATAQLADDTSLCGTSSADKIRITIANLTCYNGRNPAVIAGTLVPFSNNGHRLSISAGGGNDAIDLATDSVPGDHALCGGFGNDNIQGGSSAEYISGGHDHDSLYGGHGSDNVRGTTGQDVLNHLSDQFAPEGVDYLRGEDDADCINATSGSHVDSRSTCGSGGDFYRSTPVTSCETPTSNCCSVSLAC